MRAQMVPNPDREWEKVGTDPRVWYAVAMVVIMCRGGIM